MLPISTIHYPYHIVVVYTLRVVEVGWDEVSFDGRQVVYTLRVVEIGWDEVYFDSRLVVCILRVVGVGWDEVSFEGRQKIEEKYISPTGGGKSLQEGSPPAAISIASSQDESAYILSTQFWFVNAVTADALIEFHGPIGTQPDEVLLLRRSIAV
jgi:hypothetical protein